MADWISPFYIYCFNIRILQVLCFLSLSSSFSLITRQIEFEFHEWSFNVFFQWPILMKGSDKAVFYNYDMKVILSLLSPTLIQRVMWVINTELLYFHKYWIIVTLFFVLEIWAIYTTQLLKISFIIYQNNRSLSPLVRERETFHKLFSVLWGSCPTTQNASMHFTLT